MKKQKPNVINTSEAYTFDMKPVEEMSLDERKEALAKMRLFVESAVESEQDAPAEFKIETEKRIHLVMISISEMLGLPGDA